MGRQKFTLECRVTVFETDLPSQDVWSPESGKQQDPLDAHVHGVSPMIRVLFGS